MSFKCESNEPYYKIASEPKYYDCRPKEEYSWNCNLRYKARNFLSLDCRSSQLRNLEKLPPTDSTTLKTEKKTLLLYE